MAEDTITELEELGAEKVSGVGSPANGTPWLLLKGDVRADPTSPVTSSPEADEQKEEMTKGEAEEMEAMLTKARFQGFCDTDDCGVCSERFGPIYPQILEKSKLSAADRRKLPKSGFVFPDKAPGSGSYPIHDENHARNALSRASGKPEEKKVRAKVIARYPEMGKSTGVPDFATATPTDNGKINDGQSRLAGPMTAGVRFDHSDPAFTAAGESSYVIPLEVGELTNLPPQARMDRPGEGTVTTHVASLPIAKDSWTIEVVEKDNWVATSDDDDDDEAEKATPSPEASTTPGDGPWQAYDAATCDSVARGLAEAKIVLDQIRQREMTEAVSGNPSEWFDSYQLSCAMDDICSALGLVASLAYREAASGAEMSAKKSIVSTQSLLANIVGQARTAALGDRPSEEDSNMATITKEELDAQIAEAASKAAADAFAEMKAKQDKKDKKKAKKAKAKAKKNANNGGDITAQTMASAVHGTHDANDIGSVGGTVEGKYKNKSKKSKESKDLKKALELLQKMAQRPRSGGPVLDGQARGAGFSPASEGRATDVTKGAEDGEIATLTDRLAKSTDNMERDQISRELTLLRLRKGHEAGLI